MRQCHPMRQRPHRRNVPIVWQPMHRRLGLLGLRPLRRLGRHLLYANLHARNLDAFRLRCLHIKRLVVQRLTTMPRRERWQILPHRYRAMRRRLRRCHGVLSLSTPINVRRRRIFYRNAPRNCAPNAHSFHAHHTCAPKAHIFRDTPICFCYDNRGFESTFE